MGESALPSTLPEEGPLTGRPEQDVQQERNY
jgi:hypothetical protein